MCNLIVSFVLFFGAFPWLGKTLSKSFKAVGNAFRNITEGFAAATDQIANEVVTEMLAEGKIKEHQAKSVYMVVKVTSAITIGGTFFWVIWFVGVVFSL